MVVSVVNASANTVLPCTILVIIVGTLEIPDASTKELIDEWIDFVSNEDEDVKSGIKDFIGVLDEVVWIS